MRGRMAKIEKKTKRYPSDLTDEEWARIEPLLPRASKAGVAYRGRFAGGVERDPLHGPLMFKTDPRCRSNAHRERVGRDSEPNRRRLVDSQSVKAPEAKIQHPDRS